MLNKCYSLALAALLGIGAFAVPVSSASAATIPAVKIIAAGDVTNGNSALLLDVAYRCRNGRPCWNGRGYWNGRFYGNRYRYRRGNFIHFYGGYYYNNPWWLGAPIIVTRPAYYGGWGRRHVAWCMDRYRSYNPRTNTWVSYSGEVHQCISPFS
jgi:hypothetical protein